MSNLKHEGAIKELSMHAPNALWQHPSPAGDHAGEEELLEAPPGLSLRIHAQADHKQGKQMVHVDASLCKI